MAEISSNIEQAVFLLKNDDVVAVPTETVYGLAANALNPKATQKIYSIKNRPLSNPLIVHIKNKDEISTYGNNIPAIAHLLVEKFWPGPLTLLLDKSSIVPESTTSGSDKVALRMPQHPLTLELLNAVDFPIAAPSANPFGYISPTKAEHVQQQIGDKIKLILDGGPCKKGIESTIIGFEDNEIIIFRPGFVTDEDIKQVVGKDVKVRFNNNKKIVTSGMLPYHYSPNTPLVIIECEEEIMEKEMDKIGWITYGRSNKNFNHQINISVHSNMEEAANKLYDSLIKMDQLHLDKIYCKKFPNSGLGVTLNERIQKASNKIENETKK